jgi:serralysin
VVYFAGMPSNDVFNGTAENNLAYGLAGEDILNGGDAIDTIFGGDGNDRIRGGNGFNLLYGDDGDDLIIGGNDTDFIWAGAGDDTFGGEGGNDYLYGGTGNDVVYGGAGDDYIVGESGDDSLFSGLGADIVSGGLGADTFTIGDVDTTPLNNNLSTDLILDFNVGQGDRIKIIGGYSGIESSSNIRFALNDTAAETSSGVLVYSQSTGAVFYNKNADAPGFGDVTQPKLATLLGTPNLTLDTFV